MTYDTSHISIMYYVFLYCIYTAGIASNKSQIDKAWKKPEKDIVSLLH